MSKGEYCTPGSLTVVARIDLTDMEPLGQRTDTFAAQDVGAWMTHYDRMGYCILKDALPNDALSAAKKGCEALVETLAQRLLAEGAIEDTAAGSAFERRLMDLTKGCPGELPSLYRSELHEAAFFPLLCHPGLLDVVAGLLGEPRGSAEALRIYPNYSCRPKTPDPLHEVTWHQDAGLRADGGPATAPVAERLANFGLACVVNCWAPLLPVRAANGAMKFVPGSQREGILPHVLLKAYGGKAADGGAMGSLADASDATAKAVGSYMTAVNAADVARLEPAAVDVECDPGSVVLFSNLLVHRGGSNTSDAIRWSLDWRFQDAAKDTCRLDQGHVVRGPGACATADDWARLSLC